MFEPDIIGLGLAGRGAIGSAFQVRSCRRSDCGVPIHGAVCDITIVHGVAGETCRDQESPARTQAGDTGIGVRGDVS